MSKWIAWANIRGPFGQERADLRAGIIASTVANAAGSKHRFKATDFMPYQEKQEQSQEEISAKLDTFYSQLTRQKPPA